MRQGGMGMYGYGPRRSMRGMRGFGGYGYGMPRRSGGGCGCLSGLVAIICLAAVLVFALPSACVNRFRKSTSQEQVSWTDTGSQGTSTTSSSRTREKLDDADCVESSQWVDDQAGWLDNREKVISGMRSFYGLTGVQPYLIIADEINGSKDYTDGDVESYLRDRYDELFEDDGHLILLFCEPYENEYDPYLLVGEKAKEIVDYEGEEIIYEAIDRWYTDSSLTDDAYFARIFVASANALMLGTDFSEFG